MSPRIKHQLSIGLNLGRKGQCWWIALALLILLDYMGSGQQSEWMGTGKDCWAQRLKPREKKKNCCSVGPQKRLSTPNNAGRKPMASADRLYKSNRVGSQRDQPRVPQCGPLRGLQVTIRLTKTRKLGKYILQLFHACES